MIKLKNISRSYTGRLAVDQVNFSITRGETVALLGSSGSGKSTILRMIAGLIKPTTGTVTIRDQVLSKENSMTMRRSMGYVMQSGGLFPHLTAHDNIMMMPRHLKAYNTDLEIQLEQFCNICHFDRALLSSFPCQLSGGEKQRVSLIRALILNPEIILMDEPLGALDPMVRASLQQDLKDIFEQLKKTVLMVTHDVGEADFLADRVILLRAGQVVQEGSIASMVKKPQSLFVTQFMQAQKQVNL